MKYTTYTCTCTATLYILFRTSYIKTMTAKWRIHNPENRYDAQTGENILLKYINNISYIMITESLVTIRPGINSSQVKCHRNWQNTMYTTIVLKYLSKENPFTQSTFVWYQLIVTGQFLIVLEFKNSFKLNVTMYNTEHQLFFFQRESQRATKIIHTGTFELVKRVMLPITYT